MSFFFSFTELSTIKNGDDVKVSFFSSAQRRTADGITEVRSEEWTWINLRGLTLEL